MEIPATGLGVGEILLRLGSAMLLGAVLGTNRDLQHKPAGLRTHALVCLGAALVTVTGVSIARAGDSGAVSRTVQGIITGIGFVGAGVIMRSDKQQSVHGLTTAASIWVAACLGIACGVGLWTLAFITTGLVLLILIAGGPIERSLYRVLRGPDAGDDPPHA